MALAGITHAPSADAHNALADVNAQITSTFEALQALGKMN